MLIDAHSHILSGLDHGSSGDAMSMRQLQRAKEAGIDILAATSHFYAQAHSVEGFLSLRGAALAKTASAGIRVIPGAEVLLFPGLENMAGLDKLCYGDTKTLLIELPFSGLSDAHEQSVYELTRLGYEVLLAHVGRYDERDIDTYIELGAYAQVNPECVLDRWRMIARLLDRGAVAALGSDMHGDGDYRKYNRALKKLGGAADEVMRKAKRLISGEL